MKSTSQLVLSKYLFCSLFVVLAFYGKSQKIYNIHVIVDEGTYTGTSTYADAILEGANNFFLQYNLFFHLDRSWYANISKSRPYPMEVIDYFNNTVDLTILIMGEHKGSDVGASFQGQLGTKFGRIAVDIMRYDYERTVYILCHEIGHILGLAHIQSRDNLMNPIPKAGVITKAQEFRLLYLSNTYSSEIGQ